MNYSIHKFSKIFILLWFIIIFIYRHFLNTFNMLFHYKSLTTRLSMSIYFKRLFLPENCISMFSECSTTTNCLQENDSLRRQRGCMQFLYFNYYLLTFSNCFLKPLYDNFRSQKMKMMKSMNKYVFSLYYQN